MGFSKQALKDERGKIFQPPTSIVPWPEQAKFAGQPFTAPLRMKARPLSQANYFFGLHSTPLNTSCCLHPHLFASKEFGSPANVTDNANYCARPKTPVVLGNALLPVDRDDLVQELQGRFFFPLE
jgi:hypothetical protein